MNRNRNRNPLRTGRHSECRGVPWKARGGHEPHDCRFPNWFVGGCSCPWSKPCFLSKLNHFVFPACRRASPRTNRTTGSCGACLPSCVPPESHFGWPIDRTHARNLSGPSQLRAYVSDIPESQPSTFRSGCCPLCASNNPFGWRCTLTICRSIAFCADRNFCF